MVKKGDQELQTVIFKEDMKIMANDSGVSGMDYFYICLSIFLMVIFYVAIPLGLITGEPIFLAFCSVYLIYIIYSACHYSTRYLSNLIGIHKIFPNIEKAIAARPEI